MVKMLTAGDYSWHVTQAKSEVSGEDSERKKRRFIHTKMCLLSNMQSVFHGHERKEKESSVKTCNVFRVPLVPQISQQDTFLNNSMNSNVQSVSN